MRVALASWELFFHEVVEVVVEAALGGLSRSKAAHLKLWQRHFKRHLKVHINVAIAFFGAVVNKVRVDVNSAGDRRAVQLRVVEPVDHLSSVQTVSFHGQLIIVNELPLVPNLGVGNFATVPKCIEDGLGDLGCILTR